MEYATRPRRALERIQGATISLVFVLAATLGGSMELGAQNPTISPVPSNFHGTWRKTSPGGNCGSLRDPFGGPREFCQFPVDQLEPLLNGRARAWIEFSDETLSPRWACVAAGIQTVLTDAGGYLWSISTRPDAVVQSFEQSNWVRYIWMDGRSHPPATDIFYHGHSIGRMEGDVLVVETTNFTFDPDGWDDQSHIATSHLKTLTERYIPTGPESVEIEFTVEDPVFLKAPFTWSHTYERTDTPFIGSWDCDPEVGLRELYQSIPSRYEDDTTPAKYLNNF